MTTGFEVGCGLCDTLCHESFTVVPPCLLLPGSHRDFKHQRGEIPTSPFKAHSQDSVYLVKENLSLSNSELESMILWFPLKLALYVVRKLPQGWDLIEPDGLIPSSALVSEVPMKPEAPDENAPA